MGVRIVRELVCDLCGSTDGVQRWHLQLEGKKRSPDLCAKDGKVLAELFAKLPEKRGNQGRREVLTEAQLKKKKREYRARNQA